MMISIGSDHRGFKLKSEIIKHFTNIEFLDVGTNSEDRTDFPVYAKKVCKNIIDGKSDLGILICGSGVGISVAANRFSKIYAALCWNKEVAKMAKEDDGANVLVLPANFVTTKESFEIIKSWLDAKFKGGVYQKRLEMIEAVKFNGVDPETCSG